ncbi:hypothetical protein A6J63_000170 [Yersinia enterocolitica]|nr:hypothetical protein A6J63_000170 [Yersinia enterocolitica]HDL8433567.1 type 1 fimbrial protein [Yersinia enterocolitica]
MNYLNIRPNTLPKKNRFIWLFFIAASLYSLLSATAHAAKCSDGGSTLPGDISLTYHPNKGATSAKVVAKQKVTCEITKNDNELEIYFHTRIDLYVLKKKTERVEIGSSGLSLEYAVSASSDDNRCKKTRDNDTQRYFCDIRNNTGSVINFEYTMEVKIHKAPNIPVSREVDIQLKITGFHVIPRMSFDIPVGDFNNSIKVTSIPVSCSLNTSNINFYLGEHELTHFTHIGSRNGGSNKKRIELSCSPDTKYFLQIDGIAEPNHPGVLKLTQEPGAASGVGVQLRTGKNNEPVVFGQAKEMGTSASSGTNLQQSIDIEAYHYQTEEKVTPGSTNASATFTLTYQ